MKWFEDLSEVERGRVDAAIRAIVGTATERGRRILAQKDAIGQQWGDDERVAGLVNWPTLFKQEAYSGQAGDVVRGGNGDDLIVTRREISMSGVQRQSTGRSRAIGVLIESGLGMIAAERELWRWFLTPLEAVALVRATHREQGEHILLGVDQEGAVCVPHGFVEPAEALHQAIARHVMHALRGTKEDATTFAQTAHDHGIFSFGASGSSANVACCATLHLTIDDPHGLQEGKFFLPASDAWQQQTMVWVPERVLKQAIVDDLQDVSERLAPHGIRPQQGLPLHIKAAIADQLEVWHTGYAIG